MAHIIDEVLQIMPATGWVFREAKGATQSIRHYMPVVMFAMVQTRDDDDPDADPEKRVLPLGHYEIERLIGEDADELFRDIINVSQIDENGVYYLHELMDQKQEVVLSDEEEAQANADMAAVVDSVRRTSP